MINITLTRKEAKRFFGNYTKIANELGISQPSVTQWGDMVPEGNAFKLLYLSKLPQYRRRGKLNCKVTVT